MGSDILAVMHNPRTMPVRNKVVNPMFDLFRWSVCRGWQLTQFDQILEDLMEGVRQATQSDVGVSVASEMREEGHRP